MCTIEELYTIHYPSLLNYYKNQHFAFQVFNFIFEYIFSTTFIMSDKNKIIINKKKDLFAQCVHDITVLDCPYQYILKTISFCNCDIMISPPVLIPRFETEYWVDWLIKKVESLKDKKLYLADFCSGSGCIGIALLKHLPQSICVAFDNMTKSIELASKNGILNKVRNRYTLYDKNIFILKKNKMYDIIVSNPPYISLEDYNKLDNSLKNWEARSALTDEKQGYDYILYLLSFSKSRLKKNAILAIEICSSYSSFVRKYAQSIYPKESVFLVNDQYYKNRLLVVAKGNYKLFFENIHEI